MKKAFSILIYGSLFNLCLLNSLEASTRNSNIPSNEDKSDKQKKKWFARAKGKKSESGVRQSKPQLQPDISTTHKELHTSINDLGVIADELESQGLLCLNKDESPKNSEEERESDKKNVERDESRTSPIIIRERPDSQQLHSSDEHFEDGRNDHSSTTEHDDTLNEKLEPEKDDGNKQEENMNTPLSSLPEEDGLEAHTDLAVVEKMNQREKHSREGDTFDELFEQYKSVPLPEMEVMDDLKQDITRWIPPKTWWETLISITPDRKQAFEKLELEQELIAAQVAIEKGLRIKSSNGALELVVKEAKPILLKSVQEKRRLIRKQIRTAKQQEVITELEANQANERLRQEEIEQDQQLEASAATTQSASSWWRLFGYTQKEEEKEVLSPREEVDGFVLIPTDPTLSQAKEKDSQPETKKDEHDDITSHIKVSQYLEDKTPLSEWEESYATWFWKKGETQVIKKQEDDDQSVPYTQDEIHQLFKDQIQTYLKEETLGAFWGDSIWAYLMAHQESLQELLPSKKIDELSDDRLYFYPVQVYLRNQINGDLWREDRWEWFMKKGHVKFDLGERGMICGADLMSPLFENRRMLENFSILMFQNPKLWDDEIWKWFEANGKGRTLGKIFIMEKLFDLMCKRRKEEKDIVSDNYKESEMKEFLF